MQVPHQQEIESWWCLLTIHSLLWSHVTAIHYNTLQHTAAHYNTLQHTDHTTHCIARMQVPHKTDESCCYLLASHSLLWLQLTCNTLQHTATRCNTLAIQHTDDATHCNARMQVPHQKDEPWCYLLAGHSLLWSRWPSGIPVCCSVLQCVAVCCSVLQCVAVCCSRTKKFNRDVIFSLGTLYFDRDDLQVY